MRGIGRAGPGGLAHGITWATKRHKALWAVGAGARARTDLVGSRAGLHSVPVDEPPESKTYYSVSTTKKTVDKSAMDFQRENMFSMDQPFPGVPPLKPASELRRPETLVTTIGNGLRVASQETYGQLCTFGLVVDVGSRYETAANTGASHLMELMSFKSTFKRTAQQVTSEVEDMGGMVTANSSREQLLICVDVLRDCLEPAMEVLADSILQPLLTQEEVEEQKEVMQLQLAEMPPDLLLKEALQTAAYPGQPLGRPHFCPPEAAPGLHASMLHDYRASYFHAPRMVLAGAGVDHEEFVRLGDKYFAALPAGRGGGGVSVPPSTYIGGEARLDGVAKEKFTRVAVAFEVGGWHSDMLVPTCVLQVLLGGGDSFSAGGPGKGMYSRLYREVLNRYYWAEAAEAFTAINSESGLLGIAGAAVEKNRAAALMHTFCDHFAQLARGHVDNIELTRARNMLKCNMLTQLESRLVLFEDIGRQILTYGKRQTPEEICALIDGVTKEDIMNVARVALSKPPAISMVGEDLSDLPTHQQVVGWFGPGPPRS